MGCRFPFTKEWDVEAFREVVGGWLKFPTRISGDRIFSWRDRLDALGGDA
jgi:hypothetical protein